MFKRSRRRMPSPINTTSTSDISFILLVFFLVMTSMDGDKGLLRQMSPPDNIERQEVVDVQKSNVMSLRITSSGRLLADGKYIDVSSLRSHAMKFISGTSDREHHVIAIETDRNASYDSYFNVQNEITAAYNTLRDRYALQTYGKVYARCTAEQRDSVRSHYPQRIFETVTATGKEGGK